MTPVEFKCQGSGLTIRYGFSSSPFGDGLVAVTGRGIGHLGFVDGEDRTKAVDHLSETWPNAALDEDQSAVRPIAQRIFGSDGRDASRPFHLQLKGTNFQVNVWRALRAIPKGKVVAYGDIA